MDLCIVRPPRFLQSFIVRRRQKIDSIKISSIGDVAEDSFRLDCLTENLLLTLPWSPISAMRLEDDVVCSSAGIVTSMECRGCSWQVIYRSLVLYADLHYFDITRLTQKIGAISFYNVYCIPK